jgi:hypothetical protein
MWVFELRSAGVAENLHPQILNEHCDRQSLPSHVDHSISFKRTFDYGDDRVFRNKQTDETFVFLLLPGGIRSITWPPLVFQMPVPKAWIVSVEACDSILLGQR